MFLVCGMLALPSTRCNPAAADMVGRQTVICTEKLLKRKKRDLGKLGVAIRDHLDFGAFTAHGLPPLPHHKDAAGRRRTVGSKQKETNGEQAEEHRTGNKQKQKNQ